mgnify:CR=1 FL=1
MTEVCGWRAFATTRTAKHFRKFVWIVTQAKKKKYNSFPLKNQKFLILTPSSFSAGAYFWCLICSNILFKICSNYFKIAATLFHLQQRFLICSNFMLFAVTCGPPYHLPSDVYLEGCTRQILLKGENWSSQRKSPLRKIEFDWTQPTYKCRAWGVKSPA